MKRKGKLLFDIEFKSRGFKGVGKRNLYVNMDMVYGINAVKKILRSL